MIIGRKKEIAILRDAYESELPRHIIHLSGRHYHHLIISVSSVQSVFVLPPLSFLSNTDFTLSLQKNATQSHKLQNNQGKSMIAEDSFVPLL